MSPLSRHAPASPAYHVEPQGRVTLVLVPAGLSPQRARWDGAVLWARRVMLSPQPVHPSSAHVLGQLDVCRPQQHTLRGAVWITSEEETVNRARTRSAWVDNNSATKQRGASGTNWDQCAGCASWCLLCWTYPAAWWLQHRPSYLPSGAVVRVCKQQCLWFGAV